MSDHERRLSSNFSPAPTLEEILSGRTHPVVDEPVEDFTTEVAEPVSQSESAAQPEPAAQQPAPQARVTPGPGPDPTGPSGSLSGRPPAAPRTGTDPDATAPPSSFPFPSRQDLVPSLRGVADDQLNTVADTEPTTDADTDAEVEVKVEVKVKDVDDEHTEGHWVEPADEETDRHDTDGNDTASHAEPAPPREAPSALDYAELDAAGVAASVIETMRRVGEASRRHLEAIEAEAARRCELIGAQAELDAELIRLQARREAHAITTAARHRGVTVDTNDDAEFESDALADLSKTFERFAEEFEASLRDLPDSPDFPPDR